MHIEGTGGTWSILNLGLCGLHWRKEYLQLNDAIDRQLDDSPNYCKNGGRENHTHPAMNWNLVDQPVASHYIHWVIDFVTSEK